nr:MAG TPA: hypothetical protein [Caudoviricetes sp.]
MIYLFYHSKTDSGIEYLKKVYKFNIYIKQMIP